MPDARPVCYPPDRSDVLRIAYFHCTGGASGDMILGAAVDAGAPLAEIEDALRRLDAGGFSLEAESGRRAGVHGTLVRVRLDEEGRRRRRVGDFMRVVERSDLPDRVIDRARSVFHRLGAVSYTHLTLPTKRIV